MNRCLESLNLRKAYTCIANSQDRQLLSIDLQRDEGVVHEAAEERRMQTDHVSASCVVSVGRCQSVPSPVLPVEGEGFGWK